jgi:hypothetical protein
MKPLIVISLQLVMLMILHAEQKAITDTGEKVILNSDGTWAYDTQPVEPELGKKPDFRSAFWGDSMETVKEHEEGEPVHETTDILGYKESVAGLKMLVGYIFTQNKLTRAKYIVQDSGQAHQCK